MAGYLTEPGINSAIQFIATTYPTICSVITLPEASVEGRVIRALRIGKQDPRDHGLLYLGGVHAREVVNPDLLVSFAYDLCEAYSMNTGLTYGGSSYESIDVQLIVDALDLFILPLVNPDGRAYVQAPNGDPMWRKNRDPNAATGCIGVDLNRNFDFLWSSGIGTSSNPCDYQIYKGTAAFSEPETRNVKWLLDNFPNIDCMIDIHSFSNDLLYPWGDADDQTTDPTMNFLNPAYNGMRGIPGGLYREYIPQADLSFFTANGARVVSSIAAVRGTAYTLMQSIGLYPTSGTSDDYAFSRNFSDPTKAKVHAYTLETGSALDYFQPPYAEALNIIAEVSSGLIQFCLRCLCPVTEMARETALRERLTEVRTFRDSVVTTTAAGRRYLELLDEHSTELIKLMRKNKALREKAVKVTEGIAGVVESNGKATTKPIGQRLVEEAAELISDLGKEASPALKRALKVAEKDLEFFKEKSVVEGLNAASATAKGSPR